MDHHRAFSLCPESVGNARRYVMGVLADAHVDLQIVELLTSELATNAVVHARTNFEVYVKERALCTRVEVTNDAPEMLVAIRDPDENGGRGLRLMDALSSAWGTEQGRSAKTVWFELATS